MIASLRVLNHLVQAATSVCHFLGTIAEEIHAFQCRPHHCFIEFPAHSRRGFPSAGAGKSRRAGLRFLNRRQEGSLLSPCPCPVGTRMAALWFRNQTGSHDRCRRGTKDQGTLPVDGQNRRPACDRFPGARRTGIRGRDEAGNSMNQ